VLITGRLNEARAGLQTQLGASTYTFDVQSIEAQPGAANDLLNKVILQAPSVAQDSFGQFHVRGEHAGLQYRLNGIILPEGISVFGQTLDPRFISSMQLITGALPAEYGLRVAGIFDLTTKNGALTPGGEVSVYGGSHGTVIPSFEYSGSSGSFNYAVTGDFLHNLVGIESPDGSGTPLHDKTNQVHGFGYFDYVLNPESRFSLMIGTSTGDFQIPNQRGLQPSLGLTVNGQTDFPSENLNENQREITHYAILSFQHSQGNFDYQFSGISRYSSLAFSPDPQLGDLLYNGISQQAYKRDVSFGFQGDSALRIGDTHTVRAGFYIQLDEATSRTTSQVLPTDNAGNQTSDIPITIIDNGKKPGQSYSVYLQDEWVVIPNVTVNYGLRYDEFSAFDDEDQLSPRANVVWQPFDGTTLHAGYSRYFSPPPFELVASKDIALFEDTTAAPSVTENDTPKAERANYYDVGAQQKFDAFTFGVDTFYKQSRNLIDEGQFGAPIILTPFNYRYGRQYGVEFTGSYNDGPFSAYANLALLHAMGRDIVSSQFNFAQDELDYIAANFIHLDHEQALTASGGTSYIWRMTRFSFDLLVGTGLRSTVVNPNDSHLPAYVQVNFGVSHDFDLGSAGVITLRGDVINVFDEKYEIRNGTGVGVGAPQFGPRRGFFAGISKSF
jgi:outer membrane receptor protein involved in Fe transport